MSQVSASSKLMEAFARLHQRGLLGRFVIDEAHCVSQVNVCGALHSVCHEKLRIKDKGR